MTEIRKHLGLDYLGSKRGGLREAPPEPRHEETPEFLSDALVAYGRPMLEAIRRSAPGTARLHSLVEELRIPIEVALKVVDYLEQKRYVAVVGRDLKGNHELRLTDEGTRLLR